MINHSLLMLRVGAALVFCFAAFGFSRNGHCQHTVMFGTTCESPVFIGNTLSCRFRISHNDFFGDTLVITDVFFVIDPNGAAVQIPFPPVHIIEVEGNTTAAIGSPLPVRIGNAGSTLSGLPGEDEDGAVTFLVDSYVVQPSDPSLLQVQATVVFMDLCDDPNTQACSMLPNTFQASSSLVVGLETPAQGEAIIHDIGNIDTPFMEPGTADVAVVIPNPDAQLPGEVQIFLNLGNDVGGEWLGLEALLPTIPVGREPTGIALGDLNDDGFLDFAVSNAGDGTVTTYINVGDGTGTFIAGPIHPNLNAPSAVAIGAFGEVPGLDIAVAEQPDDVVTIIEEGAPIASLPVSGGPIALDPRDLDDDKDVDLLAAGLENAVTVIINEPGGAFTVLPDIPVSGSSVDVATGDLDLNMLNDLVTISLAEGTVTILLNLGAPDGAAPSFGDPITLNVGGTPTSVDLVDEDGDGDADIVVTSGEDLLTFENRLVPTGVFEFDPLPAMGNAGSEPQSVLCGDFDGTGPLDFVTVNRDPAEPTGGSVTVVTNTRTVCMGDVDADGTVDFADILAVIIRWGPCPGPVTCEGDLDLNGVVNFADVLEVIVNWGPCS